MTTNKRGSQISLNRVFLCCGNVLAYNALVAVSHFEFETPAPARGLPRYEESIAAMVRPKKT